MALLITLGLIVLIASMAMSFHDQMSLRLAEAKMGALDAEALSLARSGATLGKLLLKLDARPYTWFHQDEGGGAQSEDSEAETRAGSEILDKVYRMLAATRRDGFPLEGGSLALDLIDENAKVNINKVTEPQLVNLFFGVGLKRTKKLELLGENVEEDISREAAASVLNWRGWRRPGGADDTYYQNQKPPYIMRGGPFEMPEELMLVKDITPLNFFGTPPDDTTTPGKGAEAIEPEKSEKKDGASPKEKERKRVQGIGPLLTVWGDGRINANNASRAVLKVVPGLAESPQRELIISEMMKRRPFKSDGELRGIIGTAGPQQSATAGATLKVSTDVIRVRAIGIRGIRRRTVDIVLQRKNREVRTVFYKED